MNFESNLKELRKFLDSIKADAILVAMNNFFGNFKSELSGVRYISGFSGSNGRAVVSKNRALLSVDGRYTKQASEQTSNEIWTIKEFPEFDTVKMIEETLKSGDTLAIAPFSITYKSYLKVLKIAKSNLKLLLLTPFKSGKVY